MGPFYDATTWGLMLSLALFSFWLNYCMGNPLADDLKKVDVGAILFSIPYTFAKWRLREQGLLATYRKNLKQTLQSTTDPVQQALLRVDHHRYVYGQGKTFFTWERSLLCPICLHWWLAVISVMAAMLLHYYLLSPALVLGYLVSHLLIRKIV